GLRPSLLVRAPPAAQAHLRGNARGNCGASRCARDRGSRVVTAILLSFAIAFALNGAFFAVAAARKTDVVTDLSYSLTFAVLAIALPFTGGRSGVQLVASLLVVLWAARLGTYLFRRILRMKVDHRFDEMRDEPLRFARFWLLQAITVAVVMLPVSYLLDREAAPTVGAWALAGAALWLVGLVVEAVAD